MQGMDSETAKQPRVWESRDVVLMAGDWRGDIEAVDSGDLFDYILYLERMLDAYDDAFAVVAGDD